MPKLNVNLPQNIKEQILKTSFKKRLNLNSLVNKSVREFILSWRHYSQLEYNEDVFEFIMLKKFLTYLLQNNEGKDKFLTVILDGTKIYLENFPIDGDVLYYPVIISQKQLRFLDDKISRELKYIYYYLAVNPLPVKKVLFFFYVKDAQTGELEGQKFLQIIRQLQEQNKDKLVSELVDKLRQFKAAIATNIKEIPYCGDEYTYNFKKCKSCIVKNWCEYANNKVLLTEKKNIKGFHEI